MSNESPSMKAARQIVDYIALPDSAEPDDSTGSPTEYIARIIDAELADARRAADQAIDAMRATQRLFNLSDDHLLMVACKNLEARDSQPAPSQSELERGSGAEILQIADWLDPNKNPMPARRVIYRSGKPAETYCCGERQQLTMPRRKITGIYRVRDAIRARIKEGE